MKRKYKEIAPKVTINIAVPGNLRNTPRLINFQSFISKEQIIVPEVHTAALLENDDFPDSAKGFNKLKKNHM